MRELRAHARKFYFFPTKPALILLGTFNLSYFFRICDFSALMFSSMTSITPLAFSARPDLFLLIPFNFTSCHGSHGLLGPHQKNHKLLHFACYFFHLLDFCSVHTFQNKYTASCLNVARPRFCKSADK